MLVFIPKEDSRDETRIPINPESAKALVELGLDVEVETGLGLRLGYTDDDFKEAGARISHNRHGALGAADIVLRLNPPAVSDVEALKSGAIHLSYLDPWANQALIQKLADKNISAISTEMIPRTTIAQKMDSLSSQANLAGYYAVLLGATKLPKIIPMMMTPAGTLPPAKVFIIGAGVAGLQAIATAKRLGARVEAFDTRPVVEEQVQSLGAKFVKIDIGEVGQTKDGYAKALTEEQIAKQREGMKKRCAQADLVITTAQVFGRKAPLIVTREMIEAMQPGSVIVDLAAESGGNVEGVEAGKEIDVKGVTIVGVKNLPGEVPVHATQMYASNLTHFIKHFWDTEAKTLPLNLEDEIIQGALITHDGKIINETMLKHYEKN